MKKIYLNIHEEAKKRRMMITRLFLSDDTTA